MIQVLYAFTFFFHTGIDDFVVEVANLFQVEVQLFSLGPGSREESHRFLQNLIGPCQRQMDGC